MRSHAWRPRLADSTQPGLGAVYRKGTLGGCPGNALSAAASERRRRRGRSRGNADPRVPEEMPTTCQLQADALGLLAETALHHGMNPGASGERYQVVVHVDAAVLTDATRPASRSSRRYARSRGDVSTPGVRCKPASIAMLQRSPVPPLRDAVRSGPSHPALGAGRPHDALESGLALPPTSSCGPRGEVSDLRAQNSALGVHIDPHTAKPSWLGGRVDVGYAIDVLPPLALASVSPIPPDPPIAHRAPKCASATLCDQKRAGSSTCPANCGR
jgi:hypothetical protein